MALNVNELIQEFRLADAQAYLEAYPFEQLQYETRFPEQYTSDLSFTQMEANLGAKVAADVVAFNSRAPRKGRSLPGTATGGIPKIEIARDMTETDWNIYRKLQNDLRLVNATARPNVAKQLIDLVYGDQAFVVDGVKARLEWLAKQAASQGKYSLTIANNEAGVKTTVEVDFGIPTGNILKMTAANKKWSVPATSDPMGDFKRVRDAARAAGKVLRFATMEQSTFDAMAASVAFQKSAASYVSVALNLQSAPSVEQANIALRAAGLPTIIIWESFVTIEDKAGNQVASSGWVPGNITFTATEAIGNTQYTTSADEFVSVGKAQKTKSGIVLVKAWGEEDPITVITKGVAYATPVLNSAKGTFILQTEVN